MAVDNQFNIQSIKVSKTKQINKQKAEAVFETPEEVAAHDLSPAAELIIDKQVEAVPETNVEMKKKKFKLKLKWPPTKKQLLIMLVVLVVLLAGFATYKYLDKAKPVKLPLKSHSAMVIKLPTTVTSDLSGLQVSPDVSKLPVTAVMIENSIDARPQSGLGSAPVVFEAVAEGGVTRFMALYQDDSSTSLGPIRSARPYYVGWAMGFDAAYVHVGGSPDALADITSWNVKDLNQFYNGNYFQRVSSREAPHNVYSTLATLTQLEDSKGYTSSQFNSWPRAAGTAEKVPTAVNISMQLSGPDYDPSYVYNATTNSYKRSESGAAQIDANTNSQISPKVVIAIVVPESQGALDSSGAYYSDYSYLGTGNAYIFQNGGETTGQWTKASNSSQITFTDSNSQPIALDPGQVWITAITGDSSVTYSQ